jgi:hypothetical protein
MQMAMASASSFSNSQPCPIWPVSHRLSLLKQAEIKELSMQMTREQILQMHASARVLQERYDIALEPWGVRARAPTLGEHIDNYRRDLAVQTKKLLPENHELRKPQYRSMPNDVFEVMESQLLSAARTSAYRADTVPLNAPLRRVEERDANGMKTVRFIGQRSFIEDFKAPVRRVISFLLNGVHVDASGRALRR